MLDINTCFRYYSRKEIVDEIVYNSKDREVVARFNESFGKRPDTIKYPGDVITILKSGASSFHCSQELWRNPLQLSSTMNKRGFEELRIGWDLLIDIDCKIWEISKIVTSLIINALKIHGISSVSCKFSGNKGFHIGVPYEAFISEKTEDIKIRNFFPDGVKSILLYLAHYIDRKGNDFELTKLILSKYKISEIAKILDVEHSALVQTICYNCENEMGVDKIRKEEVTCPQCQELNDVISENILACKRCGHGIRVPLYEQKVRCSYCKSDNMFGDKLNPSCIIGLDTIMFSPRHLFRMPYSLHETTGLCSLPINPEDILGFNKEQAMPENVRVKERFLRKEDVIYGQAKRLLESAYNFMIKSQNKKLSSSKNIQEWHELNEKIQFSDIHFPPCIRLILNGLHDGRKRALFILLNFFSSLNLGYEDMRKILKDWNKKNTPSLPENYMESQLNYRVYNKKQILPPNCNNNAYYLDIGVCKPDNLCSKIKNPVSYVIRKIKK